MIYFLQRCSASPTHKSIPSQSLQGSSHISYIKIRQRITISIGFQSVSLHRQRSDSHSDTSRVELSQGSTHHCSLILWGKEGQGRTTPTFPLLRRDGIFEPCSPLRSFWAGHWFFCPADTLCPACRLHGYSCGSSTL